MEKLIYRVKELLLSPSSFWDEVKAEQATETEVFKNYLVFIAAVPAIAGFLGAIFMGKTFYLALIWAGLFYACSLLGVYITAKIISFLTPSFNATKDDASIFKLVAYSFTPIFLSGIFFLVPPIYWLSIVGLYGFLIFWIGFPKIIDCPKEEKFNFAFISTIIILIVVVLIFLLPALISGTSVYYFII